MLLFGILSVLQMVLLPGLLLIKIFKLKTDPVIQLILVFGLSLITNYLLVTALCIFHIYSKITIILIIIVEVVVFFWLYRKTLFTSLEDIFGKLEIWIKNQRIALINEKIETSFFRILEVFIFIVCLGFGISAIWWMTQRFINNISGVFQTWDAIVSWNNWALEWSKGLIPSTSYYPQLIPTNWSLSYVLLSGTELQSFPKMIMALFSLFIMIMIFDLAIKERSFGLLIGVVFTRLIIKKFTGEYIADGYVDLPMAFFGFAGVYLLLNAIKKPSQQIVPLVLSGTILVAGSAFTKQAGVFILLIYPVLYYLFIYRPKMEILGKNQNQKIITTFLIAFSLVIIWYITQIIRIKMGVDESNFSYVTQDIYHGEGYLSRALTAFNRLGIYKYFLASLIPCIFIVKKPYRYLNLLIAIPFSIIWLFFFSYEPRNLALVFPFWGIVIGLSIQEVFIFSVHLLESIKIQKSPMVSVFILLLIAFVISAFYLSDSKLLQNQQQKQWQVFNPELNNQIRLLVEDNGKDKKILTNYPVDFLPGLQGFQISYWYNNLEDYRLMINNPEIGYLLVPVNADVFVKDEIDKGLSDGKLELLFSSSGGYSYQLIEIVR